MKNTFILFTCEHANHSIPLKYEKYFLGKEKILRSHRGFDYGAKEVSRALGRKFNSPVIYGKFSRLLIDLNRSISHKTLFSDTTRSFTEFQKNELILKYHKPHWEKVENMITEKIQKGCVVIHIGIHSFTPILFDEIRNAEIGILYHSNNKSESRLAKSWQKHMRKLSNIRIRRNYPYNGKMDGLSTGMRKKFSSDKYLGFEIEVNHAVMSNAHEINCVKNLLIQSLELVLTNV